VVRRRWFARRCGLHGDAMSAPQTSMTEAGSALPVDSWSFVGSLPCRLSAEIPLPHFRFADLVDLHLGSVINTKWTLGNDVPLRVNGQLITWCEFDVKEGKLAVRITDLA